MTVLACDLGGTRMKIGIVRDGKVLAQTVEPANSKQGLAPQLPVLKAAWLRLLQELKLTPRDCAGISTAFPPPTTRPIPSARSACPRTIVPCACATSGCGQSNRIDRKPCDSP